MINKFAAKLGYTHMLGFVISISILFAAFLCGGLPKCEGEGENEQCKMELGPCINTTGGLILVFGFVTLIYIWFSRGQFKSLEKIN